ncbi:hypothetical protein O181_100975 [Austropuccinia psidii MF-1]|uniref:Heme peroxidase n=1 Tax=Austropuccinia psidii MF-1 TaxID=1389203 RepID=A0A9Q3PHC1_9BASI|nr:hypothetical protein [Austropuccinia psidii MF-1]
MSIFKFAQQNPTKITHRPKLGEELLQSAGYTHLLQIGSANDLPSLSKSPIWRKVSEFNLSIGTISNYLSPKANRTATTEQEIDPINLNDPTHLSYFGLQQLLSGRIPQNLEALKNTLTSLTKPLDDRKLLLEDIVGLLATSARQPLHGPRPSVNVLQGQFINLLWNDLPHPPPTDLSPQHRYRSADGSNNNLMGFPQLGAAGQAYSRSVKPLHQIPPDIAEPEELFDAILRRDYDRDGFKEHPAGLSSLMFAFANLIIHDLFWSNNRSSDNPQFQNNSQKDHINSSKSSSWQNLTSSYVSLDTLYGVNSTQQATVRDNLAENLGRGLLYNDTFASARLLLMPPASSALLILFSRNHNRIARKVLQLNERNQWQPDLSKLTQDERQQQDDEIFGTARLVNCAHFAGIVLSDYILAILNTIQADSDWILDPRMTIKNLLGSTPQAVGNSVSVEFNILC